MKLSGKLIFYIAFFAVLLAVYLFFTMRDRDFSKAPLAVINTVPAFSFTDQDWRKITQKQTDDKVYVAEYFFTTCKGICPKMNANMRRVFDAYKDEPNFLILSHTCMPEVDSVAVLKAYEQKMIRGKLRQSPDGTYSIGTEMTGTVPANSNWHFLTGSKEELYAMARNGYVIDNQKPDSAQNIADQFIHTQFFALVDKHRRVRGIYDGLEDEEIEKLLADIKALLKEKVDHKRFMTGFTQEF